MRFVDWMEACLYDEEGYYMRPGRKTGAGDDADFATSTSPAKATWFSQVRARLSLIHI